MTFVLPQAVYRLGEGLHKKGDQDEDTRHAYCGGSKPSCAY